MERLHLLLIHFPIALLFVAVLFEAIGHLRGREDFQKAGLYTLITGFAGAVLAFLSGKAAERAVEGFMGRRPGGMALLEGHESAALITVLLFAVLLIWRMAFGRTLRGKLVVAYLLLAAVGLGSVSYTGYLGGELTHPKRLGALGPGGG